MRAIFAALFAVLASVATVRPQTSNPWLFVSDVHYDTFLKHDARFDVDDDRDTNAALLDSFLAEAKRADPNPPVVFIAGDFIAHHAYRKTTAATMDYLARRFDQTFPQAQFVFTLGNNDSDCDDYAPTIGGAFLASVARSWEPLVNRNGAAPGFAKTFAHDGSYVAKLPLGNLRAVVVDDNFLTLRYNEKCAGANGPGRMLAGLRSLLQSANDRSAHNIVLFHVPPGIDAYSTSHLAHHLVVVPFLQPPARDALLHTLADPKSNVALVVAGHTHKFAFRIVPTQHGDGIPMLLIPSVSPVFGNHPSFLVAPMEPSESLGNIEQIAFDDRRWFRLGDLASLGVPRFEARALRRLQAALIAGSPARERFAAMYEGGATSEIDASNWTTYACASKFFGDTAFERCIGTRGIAFVTVRGLAAAICVVLALIACIFTFLGWRSVRPSRSRREGA